MPSANSSVSEILKSAQRPRAAVAPPPAPTVDPAVAESFINGAKADQEPSVETEHQVESPDTAVTRKEPQRKSFKSGTRMASMEELVAQYTPAPQPRPLNVRVHPDVWKAVDEAVHKLQMNSGGKKITKDKLVTMILCNFLGIPVPED
jgi:hypothetical protein